MNITNILKLYASEFGDDVIGNRFEQCKDPPLNLHINNVDPTYVTCGSNWSLHKHFTSYKLLWRYFSFQANLTRPTHILVTRNRCVTNGNHRYSRMTYMVITQTCWLNANRIIRLSSRTKCDSHCEAVESSILI